MRIGVLGGSFDPPHLGHIALAECAHSQLGLDLVLFAVANRQWQKDAQTPAADRMRMVELALAGRTDLRPSDVDIRRGGETATIDTMTDLRQAHPGAEFWFLIGADAVAGLASWRRYPELAAAVEFAAAPRAGYPSPIPPPGTRLTWLDCRLPDIAACDIRAGVAAGRLDAAALATMVPAAVAEDIIATGRYA